MESSEDIYRFDPERTHQGLAVLIVNFTSGTYKRSGAINDLKYMKKTFKRLGFKVECHKDVKTSDFETLLKDYSECEDLKKYDCFAFGISSHGVELKRKEGEKFVNHHAIQTFDREYFYTKDIIDKFSHQNCTAFRNKPKLFFIQACRIPLEKTSKDHFARGVGFVPGINLKHVNPGQGSSDDQKDYWTWEDEGSVEEDFVSDTDDEDDQLPAAAANTETFSKNQGIGEVEQDLERGQLENVDNLKPLNSEAVEDRPGYSLTANQLKDQNVNASANQNKEQSNQLAANQNKEDEPQTSPNQNKEQRSPQVTGDKVDPAKGRTLYPSGGDTTEHIHIVSVPCDKDMLVMYASPQGHYAFRNERYGSYMLKFLYEVVKEHYGNGIISNNQTSFLDVLLGVAARMAERTYFGQLEYTIVPSLVHKLSKDIIFMQGKKMVASKFL